MELLICGPLDTDANRDAFLRDFERASLHQRTVIIVTTVLLTEPSIQGAPLNPPKQPVPLSNFLLIYYFIIFAPIKQTSK